MLDTASRAQHSDPGLASQCWCRVATLAAGSEGGADFRVRARRAVRRVGGDGEVNLQTRASLLARWATLTREILPGMADQHGWPIRLDHCFMRVCLDMAVEAPWPTVVARPAIRHLSDDQLARAVAVADGVRADPSRLPALNERSLALRRSARAAGGGSRRLVLPKP